MHILASVLLGIATFFGGLFGVHQAPQTFGSYNPTGGGTYRLQTSIGTSNTSITLSSFKEPISNLPYTMSYLNTSIEYGTLEPQTNNREFISFTGITQNGDGTATLTGVQRGLSSSFPFTASTTLQLAHPGQSIFIISNSPAFYANQFLMSNQLSTSTAVLLFSSTTPPRYDSTAAQSQGNAIATTSELASVAYVNAVALVSAPNSTETVKGVIQLATGLQQASSTATGSTGAGLVLRSSYATDTPTYGCSVGFTGTAGAGCTPIADLAGKIWKTIVGNLSIANTWALLQTFTSGLTSNGAAVFNSTVNIVASASNKLTLNGVAYVAPPAQATASSTSLCNDSSGNLSWCNSEGQLVGNGNITTTVSNASTTLLSVVVPANYLGLSSGFAIKAIASSTNDSNWDVQIGDGNSSTTIAAGGNSSGVVNGIIDAQIYNNGTASRQNWASTFTGLGATQNTFYIGNSSVNTASKFFLSFRAKTSGVAGFGGISVRVITQ